MKTRLFNRKYQLIALATVIITLLGLASCWRASVPVPHPTSLYAFAQCVEDINSYYVIGGADNWGQPMDHFLRFDASLGVWYRLAPMPTPSMAAAASCYQGHIYVVTPEQDLYIYDIASESWLSGSIPPRAAWGAAIGIWNGKLYLVGGSPAQWGIPSNEINVYDIENDSWGTSSTLLPVATYLPGYTQAGPYLFVVGGFGIQSPAQNVDATQRYDMSADAWELGPVFTTARAAFSLSIQGYLLYASGGDANSGTYLDEVADMEILDLNGWHTGAWSAGSPVLSQAKMFHPGSFCTEAILGGEIWSVGGAVPDDGQMNALTEILYRDPNYGQGAGISIWQEAMIIPPELIAEAKERADQQSYPDGDHSVTTNGNCYTGEFNLSIEADHTMGYGLPTEAVTYSLALTNTGDIPDFWDITINSAWQTEISSPEPIWPNMSDRLVVTVTIPTDAAPFDQDTAEITFTSQGDALISKSLELITQRHTGIDLIPPLSVNSGARDTMVIYTLALRNATGLTDSFTLELGAHNWETSISSDQIGPIEVGETEIFTAWVVVPPEVEWYLTDTVTITANAQNQPGYSGHAVITTEAYAPPELSYTPEALESTQFPDQTVTQTLTISNGNGVTLTFGLGENIEDDVILLRLDEPAGSTLFHDSSGMGNHGTCTGNTCPISGVPGHSGNTVLFDGINDQIQAPATGLPTGNSDRTLAAWVRLESSIGDDKFIAGYGTWGNYGQAYWLSVGYGDQRILCFSQWGQNICGAQLQLGVWYHAAVTNVGNQATLYLNGVQVASGTLEINTSSNSYFQMGLIPGEPSRTLNGSVDDVIVIDHALSAQEIMRLYLRGPLMDMPWLSIEPISGSIPTNGSMSVSVAFDSAGLQPDIYTTTLPMISNDPTDFLVEIPVSMTVEPPPSMGWVEGVVTDLRTGHPLEATIIAEGQPYTITSNVDTGNYKLWLVEGGYTIQVSATGYVTQTIAVNISAHQGITQDFALLYDAPWLQLEPDSFHESQMTGEITTNTLSIQNLGSETLNYEFSKLPHNSIRIVSDSSWRVSGSYESGWETNGFDDSTWNYTIAPAPVNCGWDHCIFNPDILTMWSQTQYTTIYLRKSFEIPIGAPVISATITSFCDDDQDIYINGVLVASDWDGVAGPALETEITTDLHPGENVIAIKANDTAGVCRHLCLEAIINLDTTYSDWITIDPISGTLLANTSATATITLSAIDLQPDLYTTTLRLGSNDPFTPIVNIPIEMTVEPSPSMGWVEGIITDLRTGAPLEGAIFADGQPFTVTSNAETGYYQLWLEEGESNLQVSASGYISQTEPVTIRRHHGVTQDFSLLLDSPWLQVEPESLEVTQFPNLVTTQTLALINNGVEPLEYDLVGDFQLGNVLYVKFDEPEGTTTFHDYSGRDNDASCSGNSCPIAGAEGRYGHAIDLDGVNDFVAIPHNPQFDEIENNDRLTIAAWINVENTLGLFPILDQYEASGDWGWMLEATQTGIYFYTSSWTSTVCNYVPNLHEWHHIALTYDRGQAIETFYIDGVPLCSYPNTGDIADTQGEPIYIGLSASGGDEYGNGLIDEVAVWNRALSADEIWTLYQNSDYSDFPLWMSIEPISGTIPANSSQNIVATFNSMGLQPDIYPTAIHVISNDSLIPMAEIPITMTVESTNHMGWVEGTITDLRTGEPLEATIVAEGQPYTVTSDAETGYYKLWLERGLYTLLASTPGYIEQTAQVEVRNHNGVTQDFALLLDAPWLQASPEKLETSLLMGDITVQTLTITNAGTVDLDYNLSIGLLQKNASLLFHFDESAGSSTFYDVSGNDNHGFCSGSSCPTAGVNGQYNKAISFDGIDDHVVVTDSPSLSPARITIAAWVKLNSAQTDWSPITFKEGPEGRAWWFGFTPGRADQIHWSNGNLSTWSLDAEIPSALNEWRLIVATYEAGGRKLYVDGNLIASDNATGNLLDTTGSMYIGGGGWVPMNGLVDELSIFERALTSEEIHFLFHTGTIPSDISWLTVEPISGTITTHSSQEVTVEFDATRLQPDTYTTTLIIANNDPLNPFIQLPVTMTVELPPSAGLLTGNISTPGYCEVNPGVLAEAELLIVSSAGMTWTVTTDDSGTYSYWLDENGSPYTVTASLPGYQMSAASGVSIVGGQTTPQDFSLRWLEPCLTSTPDSLAITLQMGLTGTLPLVITNTGAVSGSFELVERDANLTIPTYKEAVVLTIPAAPDVAPVGSAVAAGPYTPRKETTISIHPLNILAEAPRVLLLNADDGDGQYIRDQLLAYGDLASVDSFNARLGTPTLDELQSYDVVLTWSNYPYADPAGIGDVLADYVDAGGYVVNLMYALGEHGWQMEGRFMDESYNAIQGGLVKYKTSCLGEYYPGHFIFLGVEQVCEFYRLSDTSLTPGATTLAYWQDGEIFVASNASRSVISITGYVGYYYRWSGQMDRVVHNAILWFILGDDIPWLATVPVSGTVAADGGSVTVSVRFDTLNYQPGEFLADLLLFSDDPVRSLIQVPVSLTVTPNPDMGWVEGVITDLRTSEPIEATIIAQGQPYSVTSNADTGEYTLWLMQGSYTLTASAPGYVTGAAQVEILPGSGTLQDFALLLDAPWMQYDPQEFDILLSPDQLITRTLALTNTGAEDLDFRFGGGISGAVIELHVDEPAGATTFQDTSGYDNDAYCSGTTCPTAGVPGMSGTSVDFDGVDDYLEIPHNAELDLIEESDRLSIAAWVKVDNVPYGNFAMLNQYEADGDLGWEYFISPGSVDFVNWTYNGYTSCSHNFYPDQWYHVAMTYDRSLGSIQFYVNGIQICNNAFSGDILDTVGEPAYIGYNPSGADEYGPGSLDELFVFNRVLTPDEVTALYQVNLGEMVSWLSVDPRSGSIAPDSSLPVQVSFDSAGLEPNTYTTTLYISSNDPLNPMVQVPVTMTVIPEPVPPTAVTISGPVDGLVGEPYAFTAVVEPISTSLPLEYTWQASGQSPVTHTGGLTDTFSVIWESPGTQDITVTASNLAGHAIDTHTIIITDIPIEGLVADNDSPTELGSPTILSATVQAGTHVTYAWDLDDGTTGEGKGVEHTYPVVGSYTATVTATNTAGHWVAITAVSIVDVPIQGLSASNDSPTLLGEPTTLSATAAAGSNIVYSWSYGDGETGSGAVIAHTYSSPGTYAATVTATNSAGSLTTETQVIIILPPRQIFMPLIFNGRIIETLKPETTLPPPLISLSAHPDQLRTRAGAIRKPVSFAI